MVEVDDYIKMSLGAITRKISSTWINPAKSRGYFEDLRRVLYKDESPEGLYPACVVTQNFLGKVVVIVPIEEFQKLLDLWKKENPEYVKSIKKILEDKQNE